MKINLLKIQEWFSLFENILKIYSDISLRDDVTSLERTIYPSIIFENDEEMLMISLVLMDDEKLLIDEGAKIVIPFEDNQFLLIKYLIIKIVNLVLEKIGENLNEEEIDEIRGDNNLFLLGNNENSDVSLRYGNLGDAERELIETTILRYYLNLNNKEEEKRLEQQLQSIGIEDNEKLEDSINITRRNFKLLILSKK